MNPLLTLVGISPTPDIGDPSVAAYDTTVSVTGLYLTALVNETVLADAGNGRDTFPIIYNAYQDAVKQVPLELATFLGGRLQARFQSSEMTIGEARFTSIVAVPSGKAGFELATLGLTGGFITIRKVGLLINAPATVNITIERTPLNGETELLKVWQLTVKMDSSITYPVNELKLPIDGSTYRFSYPLNGTYYPRNNQLSCGCGGKDQFINKVLAKPLGQTNGNLAHGLLLEVALSCDFSQVATDLLINNQYTAALAHLLYYKAGLNILDGILNGMLTPYSQLRAEDLQKRREEWTAQMGVYLTFLTQNWNPSTLPLYRCYTCAGGPLYKTTITA